jgi:hypothetical protein
MLEFLWIYISLHSCIYIGNIPESDRIPMEDFHKVVLALPVPVANHNEVARPMRNINQEANAAIGKQKRSVFLIDYKPLWGCSSLCGWRSEMEDAYMVVPGFIDVPIWLLTKEPKIEGIDDMSTFKVTAHFFGVYDGHGGAQVSLPKLVECTKIVQVENKG